VVLIYGGGDVSDGLLDCVAAAGHKSVTACLYLELRECGKEMEVMDRPTVLLLLQIYR
jgi:hypothetical protein